MFHFGKNLKSNRLLTRQDKKERKQIFKKLKALKGVPSRTPKVSMQPTLKMYV
jgi:hypothetical protein